MHGLFWAKWNMGPSLLEAFNASALLPFLFPLPWLLPFAVFWFPSCLSCWSSVFSASKGHFPRFCLSHLLLLYDLPWQPHHVINPIFLNQNYLTPTPKPVSVSPFLKLLRHPNHTHGSHPLLPSTFNASPAESAYSLSPLGPLLYGLLLLWV